MVKWIAQIPRRLSLARMLRIRHPVLFHLTVALLLVGVWVPVVQDASAAHAVSPSALARLQQAVAAAEGVESLHGPTIPPLVANLPVSSFSIPALLDECSAPTFAVSAPPCSFGDVSSKRTVVLYGNSQAQAWAPALARLGTQHHFRVIPLVKPACGTFFDAGYLDSFNRVSTICDRFAHWAAARIKQLRPVLVVVASTPGVVIKPGFQHYFGAGHFVPHALVVSTPPNRTAADFDAFIRAIRSSRTRIVLLSDIPISFRTGSQHQTTTGCLLRHEQELSACAFAVPTPTNSEWRRAFEDAAHRANVPFVDVTELMCAHNSCPQIVDHVLVHFNYLHVSAPFASLATDALGDLLAPYLPEARVG